jgi:thioredoxin reductase (NADPH)
MHKNKNVALGSVTVLLISVMFLQGCEIGRSPSIDIANAFDKKNIVPLVILGSGPAGLSAAIYGVWSNIKTLIIHGPTPGGLLTETTWVENWPGNKSILGPDIIKNLEDQVKTIGTKFKRSTLGSTDFLEDVVTSIDFSRWPYEIQTEQGRTINALAIILATGASPKMLGVAGEKEFWKNGVTTCAVCDGGFFKDQEVVVVGGGDSAIEEAMQLARHAKLVTMLVRKDRFRASPTMQARLGEYPTIKVQFNVEVKKIVGDEMGVNGVEIFNNTTQETKLFPTSGVFLAIGHTPNSKLVKGYVKMNEQGYVLVNGRTQTTSLEGLFAAGEVEDNLYRQAGVASGHGIQAALDAINFLNAIGFNTTVAQKLEPQFFKPELIKSGDSLKSIESAAEFDRLIEKDKGIIVADFYQDGCPGCDALAPTFESVAQKMSDKAQFVKVHAGKAYEITKRLFIQSVPVIVIYNNGKLAARYQGGISEKDLIDLIEHIVAGGTQLPALAGK